MSLVAQFGQRLSEMMQQKKFLSLSRLAQEVGVDTMRVSDWLLDRGHPSVEETVRLAHRLGVSTTELKRWWS